jgi:hypothetical protein
MAPRLIYLVSAFAIVGFSESADTPNTGVLKLPQDIEFRGPLTGPPQLVVLYGDPTKPGSFSRASGFAPAARTRRIGTLTRYVLLSCYQGRSTTATVTNGMRAS